MYKLLLVFFIGLIESLLYTMYLISLDKRKIILSTILMFIYMLTYLLIIAYAIKDSNSISLLTVYALSSAMGNYIIIKREKNRDLKVFKHKQTHPHHSKRK